MICRLPGFTTLLKALFECLFLLQGMVSAVQGDAVGDFVLLILPIHVS